MNLKDFISNFIARSGNYIFVSGLISKILSLLASWTALQLIPNKDLGYVIFAFQIILFIAPISSLGLNQGLIRYGSLTTSLDEKNSLFKFVLIKGIYINLGIIALIFVLSQIIAFEDDNIHTYLLLLSFALLTQFLFEICQIQFRVFKKNKAFAITDLTYNIILVSLVFILSYTLEEFGYALALVLTPLITAILSFKKLEIKWKPTVRLDFITISFWRYGFFASLSNVTTSLLVAIDLILIGTLMHNMEQVTAFKYVSLVPFSVIFLSQAMITTDFVDFTEKISSKKYINSYIKNYMKLFFLISLLFIAFITVFGKIILNLFDSSYIVHYDSLLVLSIGVTGILIIRGVFGNLLSSIGKAHINFVITSLALIINYFSNSYLIPKWGLFGASITTASLMWLTSIMCAVGFYYYYKKENKKFKKVIKPL